MIIKQQNMTLLSTLGFLQIIKTSLCSYMIPGGVGGGWWVLSLNLPPEKILSLNSPSQKKILGPKMGKFGQKMSFFGNFLTNPRDFHKSAVKFHEIL
jgi:hypothetical protein